MVEASLEAPWWRLPLGFPPGSLCLCPASKLALRLGSLLLDATMYDGASPEMEAFLRFVALQAIFLSYPDMAGRAARYMINGYLPACFKSRADGKSSFPTHVHGAVWCVASLLDCLAQVFVLPPHVSGVGIAPFLADMLPRSCMVARKVRCCGALAVQTRWGRLPGCWIMDGGWWSVESTMHAGWSLQ